MSDLIYRVLDDITSRGALAGAASAVAIASAVAWWWVRTRRIHDGRTQIAHSIVVTGSRGKSSVVRLLDAVLRTSGHAPYSKMTGTAAAELDAAGTENATHRLGQVSILEMFDSMQRAFSQDLKVDSIVMECMAVSPELIELTSKDMLKPDIVVITNAQLDHLEDEGTTLEEVAQSLCRAITPGCFVVTGETRPGPRSVIEVEAMSRKASLAIADATDLVPSVLERLPHCHPQNVAMVLAVAQHLGIPESTAIAGMAAATNEPSESEIWERAAGPVRLQYIDLGAINDPDSLQDRLEMLASSPEFEHHRFAVLTGRWDRPLRALEFAGFITPDKFDGVIIAGGPVYMIRSVLRKSGWPRKRLKVVTYLAATDRGVAWRLRRILRRMGLEGTSARLVGLENEHDAVADRVRAYFHRGRRIRVLPMHANERATTSTTPPRSPREA